MKPLGMAWQSLRPFDMKKSTSDAPINEKGGEVSTVIYERMQAMSGDPSAVNLYGTLLTAAGVPYVEMFRVWTTTGRPEDPYKKLCIKESKYISTGILEVDFTDEYWEGQYTVFLRHVLLKVWSHNFLLAGKYLNVIRECGIEVQADQKDLTKTSLSMEDEKHISSLGWVPVFFFVGISRLYKFIEGACTHANRTPARSTARASAPLSSVNSSWPPHSSSSTS